MLKEVLLEVGKSSNKFSSMNALLFTRRVTFEEKGFWRKSSNLGLKELVGWKFGLWRGCSKENF